MMKSLANTQTGYRRQATAIFIALLLALLIAGINNVTASLEQPTGHVELCSYCERTTRTR